MFLSRKLIEYISPKFKDITSKELIDSFNSIGVEVEQIEKIPYINNLVFGKIKSFEKIEGSKNLNYCLIETANEELNIVCGANNLELNKFVVVAKIGAKFSDDFIISKRKLLNHESNGMICGYSEILSSREKFMTNLDKNGVIIIDEEIDLNSSVYEFLNLDDEIYELSIPSNRNDLNGVLALINELNYQLNINFKINNKRIRRVNAENVNIFSSHVSDYVISTFKNLITKTHWFIKSILINSKINSVSNLVDISNFVTLLSANPIHFYDADKINNKLTIIDSTEEYKMTTLNNQEIDIPMNSTIAIQNNKVSSLVGIIGGHETMVTENTKNVLVEILNIDSEYISVISKKLNIKNNSSSLFSKPLSSDYVRISFWLLYEILDKLGIKLKIIASKLSKKMNFIKLNANKISSILGIAISNKDINRSLVKAGIKILWNYAIIPNSRIDLNNIQDIAEEILKSFDINKFPEKEISSLSKIKQNNVVELYSSLYGLKKTLTNIGLFETKTMNLVSEDFINRFNWNRYNPIKIINPISNNRKYMRVSLIPSLIEVIENNIKAKEETFNLFEIQKIYTDNLVKNLLTILLTKNIFNDIEQNNYLSITDAKLVINKIESYFNAKFSFSQSSYNGFTKNQFNIILDSENIGFVGELKNKYFKESIYAIEINLSKLVNLETKKIEYIPKSQLNPIYRELTFSNPNNNSINEYIHDVMLSNYLIEDIKPIICFKNEQKNTTTLKIKIKQKEILGNQEIDLIFKSCIEKLKDYGLILNDKK